MAKQKQDTPDELLDGVPLTFDPAVPIEDLLDFPGNPKDHDIGAILQSIEQNGVADAIRAQLSTKRILGGHGTREAYRHRGMTHVPVLWVDCDDRRARKLLLAYNRVPQLGGFNQPALIDFLTIQAQAGDLLGSGYDGDDLDTMIQRETFDPNPSGTTPDKTTGAHSTEASLGGVSYQIVVHCANEHEQATITTELEARGLKCRLLTL